MLVCMFIMYICVVLLGFYVLCLRLNLAPCVFKQLTLWTGPNDWNDIFVLFLFGVPLVNPV